MDSTMMSCFRSCPRKFYHEFLLGLRPADVSVDLHAGGAFAKGIESFYKSVHEDGAHPTEATRRAMGDFLSEWGDFVPRSDTPKSKDRMMEALFDYISTYPPGTDHVQPYRDAEGKATYEFTFAIPLEEEDGFPLHPSGEPFVYCGRFDMLGSYLGRPCVRDEKTTKYLENNWSEKWDLRSQFMGYVWACQQYGYDLDTVIVRGIAIQKTQIKHAEAIKIYPSYMVERWYEQLKRDMWRVRRCWDEGYFDYNFGDSCTAYGRCPFTSLCGAKEPETWMGDYVVRRWNPIQKNPIEGEKSVP
jgi:hypothetical protein